LRLNRTDNKLRITSLFKICQTMVKKEPLKRMSIRQETVLLPASKKRLSFELRVRQRARHLRLKIHPDGDLRVVLPYNVPAQKAYNLIIEKENWILKHLKKRQLPSQKKLSAGDSVLYRGESIKIRALSVSEKTATIRLRESFFEVRLPQNGNLALNEVLVSWFHRQAKIQIVEETRRLAEKLGVEIGRVSIRDQKTRWGSCSSRKNLNFNWRLLMAPPSVLRYVIIHELTHLKQMNHSKEFWSLVAKRCPDYKTHQKWLKEHGAELRQI